MKIDVYSRRQAIELEPSEKVAMISISGPGKPAPLKEGWGDMLRLEFHDIVSIEEVKFEGLTPMTLSHADEVHDFIEANKSRDFAVHCDAGVSRSVAVGMYLRDTLGGDLTTHAICTTEMANSLVLRQLRHKDWMEHFDAT